MPRGKRRTSKAKAPSKAPRPADAGKRGPLPGQGGAPRKELTVPMEEQLQQLAGLGCTQQEMANRLGIDEETLADRVRQTSSVAAAIKAGKADLHVSLRRQQVRIALSNGRYDEKNRWIPPHPNQATMLIFLGKVILGQSERLRITIDDEGEAMKAMRELYPELPDSLLAALAGKEAEEPS